jgi:hypothetical protein
MRSGAGSLAKSRINVPPAFLAWLRAAATARLVVIEISAGFSTPAVIRWPCESIVAHHSSAHLIRINPEHPETQHAMDGRSTCITARAAAVLSLLSGSG